MKKALTILMLLLFLCVGGYADFASVITAIGARESTLTIYKQYNVTDDLVIPANVTLRFLQGGSLNISNTKTVTINGYVEAGLFQIFEGSGAVSFGKGCVNQLELQWFGAVSGTDCTTAFCNALDAGVLNGNVSLHIGKGDWQISKIEKTTSANSGMEIYGDGFESKITITNTDGSNGIRLNSGGGNDRCLILENFRLVGNVNSGHGLYLYYFGSPSRLKGLTVDDFSGTNVYGIYMDDMNVAAINSVRLDSCYNGVALYGRSHAVMINHLEVNTYDNYGIALLEDGNGISPRNVGLYNYTCYGPSGEAGKSIYGEGVYGLTVVNPYMESTEHGIYLIDGPVSGDHCYYNRVINPYDGGAGNPHIYVQTPSRSHFETGNTSGIEVAASGGENIFILNRTAATITGTLTYTDKVIETYQAHSKSFRGVINDSTTKTYAIPSGGIESGGLIVLSGDFGKALAVWNKTIAGVLSITEISDAGNLLSIVANDLVLTNETGNNRTYVIDFHGIRAQEITES